MKAKNFFDFLKTCLIYLLTASMLTTAGLYINARKIAGQSDEIPRDKLGIFKIGGMALAEIDEKHVSPLQITITVGKNSFTAVYSDKSVSDIYEYGEYGIKGMIRDIFGRDSECRILGMEEGEKLWSKCAALEKSIYIKYAGNYIYPFIYTFLDKDWDIRNSAEDFSGELAMVHELFITDEGEANGVAKDIYGNVSLFVPSPEAKNRIRQRLGDNALSKYKDITMAMPCEFLKSRDMSGQTGINANSIENLKFPENFHLFQKYDTYSSVLNVSNPFLDAGDKVNTDHAYVKNLFNILNFNIENSASYSEGNGLTFRDSKNTVRFFGDGQIIYSHKPPDSEGNIGGLHLAKFLGYSDDYYTYYEKIKAASAFVVSLGRESAENECGIYFTDATIDPNGDMNVVFSYYYEGAEIKINGSSEAVVLTIDENSFTQIKINALYLSRSPQRPAKNRNPIFELRMIDREIAAELRDTSQTKEEIAQKYNLSYDKTFDRFVVGKFSLVYKIDYAPGEMSTAEAVWELG